MSIPDIKYFSFYTYIFCLYSCQSPNKYFNRICCTSACVNLQFWCHGITCFPGVSLLSHGSRLVGCIRFRVFIHKCQSFLEHDHIWTVGHLNRFTFSFKIMLYYSVLHLFTLDWDTTDKRQPHKIKYYGIACRLFFSGYVFIGAYIHQPTMPCWFCVLSSTAYNVLAYFCWSRLWACNRLVRSFVTIQTEGRQMPA